MRHALFAARDLFKAFDGVRALDGFSCRVETGEVVGLIGSNGAGKTTFFNIVTGLLSPDSGGVQFKGADILRYAPHRRACLGLARTFQELRLIRRLTVLDNALLACRGNPAEDLAGLFFRWKASRRYEAEKREMALSRLEQVGLAGKVNDLATDLSYGQQKLLCLACCLLADADLLLLDEPVAGVAPEIIDQVLSVIGTVRDEGRSVILIEHNIDAVTQVCSRVMFMDSGRVVSEGTPEEVRADPQVIEAYLAGSSAQC